MRIPRDLSGMELVKALCRDWDYRVVHQEGSHIILQTDTPTHQRLSMPSHNPLRVGTLNAIALAPAWFVRARQEDMGQVRLRRGYGGQARFALVELCALPIPRDWPQFGIDLTAGWARRGWQGGIAHTRLPEESPG